MEQTTTETTEEVPKRPQFLTVLCILTFIGVGLGIIMSIVGWLAMRTMSAMMDTNSDMMEGMSGFDMSEMPDMENTLNSLKYAKVILISGVISSLICLIGALQMWKQKKIGFLIYVVGQVAPIIVSVVCLGAATFSGWNSISLVFPVVFVVLYGLNLKHLS